MLAHYGRRCERQPARITGSIAISDTQRGSRVAYRARNLTCWDLGRAHTGKARGSSGPAVPYSGELQCARKQFNIPAAAEAWLLLKPGSSAADHLRRAYNTAFATFFPSFPLVKTHKKMLRRATQLLNLIYIEITCPSLDFSN